MFPILLVLWFLFSGSFTGSNLIKGVIVCGLITFICWKFMGYEPKKFYRSFRKAGQVIRYFAILVKEIIVANLMVIRFVWRKEQPQAVLVRFKTHLKTDAAKVLVANSITLTPGTFTVGLKGDTFVVHALTASFADSIENSVFFQEAEKLEE